MRVSGATALVSLALSLPLRANAIGRGKSNLWEQIATDPLLTVAGAVLGALGVILTVAFALSQLRKTRKAAEAARDASAYTRQILRTSDLRRVIVESLEVGKRINNAKAPVVAQFVEDWLAAYQRIFALLKEKSLPPALLTR